MKKDSDYMRLAMDLALKGRGRTSPNPMVGALIVKGGRIIAGGYHRRCGEDHAEVMALKKAGARARGAKMYVTLEPCSHYGRTPPCADRIIQSGIREVVVGMKDPNPLNNGRSLKKLARAGIRVKSGLLEEELKRLNEVFIKYIRSGQPFVVVKSAQTLDGKIATSGGNSKWITSAKTRAYARFLRNDFDGILVGIRTILKDDPLLNALDKTKRIKKIILDSALRISARARVMNKSRPQDVILAVSSRASRIKVERFRKKGYNVIVCPLKNGRLQLSRLVELLGQKEVTSLLVEGGAHVIGEFFREKLADKAMIFIAPKILGDEKALSSIIGLKTGDVNKTILLRDMDFWRIAEDILIEGYVQYV